MRDNMLEIAQFLTDNDVDYEMKRDGFRLKFDNPNKRSYEIMYVSSLDFPIENRKLGIEGVNKKHFFNLSLEAEHENNSFKCWVRDYEWENERQRNVLKSYFLYAAGKIPNRFFARDCEVRVVNTKEGRAFEEKNCFYGKRGASLSLGLYLKKEKNDLPKGTLVMIYTFGLNFFGKDKSLEVLRVGTLLNSNVVGGASKLLKHFIKNYPVLRVGKSNVEVKKIKFYTDYCHNIGSSMSTLGFDFVGYSEGGFMNYWIHERKVKQRQPNKHKWVVEQMKLGNVIAVPTAGVKTHVLDVEKYTGEKDEKI